MSPPARRARRRAPRPGRRRPRPPRWAAAATGRSRGSRGACRARRSRPTCRRRRSRSARARSRLVPQLQHRQERLLGPLDAADLLHPLLALLLLLEQLALTRDVAAVALGDHVLAHWLDRLA